MWSDVFPGIIIYLAAILEVTKPTHLCRQYYAHIRQKSPRSNHNIHIVSLSNTTVTTYPVHNETDPNEEITKRGFSDILKGPFTDMDELES